MAGAAVLGVGIWVTVDKNSLLGILDKVEDAPPELAQLANVGYLMIAVGGVLAIMGFLGCCGAISENKCMLLTFFIIVLIIFLAEVAGAIVVFVFAPLADELLQKVNTQVVTLIQKEYGADTSFTTVMNNTMNWLDCCGYNNYTDFNGSPFQAGQQVYPETCCISHVCNSASAQAAVLCHSWISVMLDNIAFSSIVAKFIPKNVTGCFNALVKELEDNAVVLGGVAIGIAALEIAAMIVSMVLYNSVGK
ncbi:hypothetical protein NFI96_011307 [Prochilodus magdalenae]|nr:hypothetical protein NFI96_011307 [Prochilodus magdalenae]